MSGMEGLDNWLTTTPADRAHKPECNCPKCHADHVDLGEVKTLALEPDFQCCKDELEGMIERGEACRTHPKSYCEPGYCEDCVDSVRAGFAYYDELGGDPFASYLIVASEHPMLPVHGNVSGETLMKYRVNLPVTPTFETWVSKGRPVWRGQVAS